jgi:hypothetical protein
MAMTGRGALAQRRLEEGEQIKYGCPWSKDGETDLNQLMGLDYEMSELKGLGTKAYDGRDYEMSELKG